MRSEYANGRRPLGFTPVGNARIAKALQVAFARAIALHMTPRLADIEARATVARALPPLPFAKRYRLPKPSRSDDPSYRKPIVLKSHRSCAVPA
jgi:hypothetical protein